MRTGNVWTTRLRIVLFALLAYASVLVSAGAVAVPLYELRTP